jgi:hypothetical protein
MWMDLLLREYVQEASKQLPVALLMATGCFGWLLPVSSVITVLGCPLLK